MKDKEIDGFGYLDGIHYKDLVRQNLGKTIKNPKEIFFEDCECKLIIGRQVIYGDEINKAINKTISGEYPCFITLKDIEKYIKKFKKAEEYFCPLVIAESPLSGTIYRLGNHIDGKWELVGEMIGYA